MRKVSEAPIRNESTGCAGDRAPEARRPEDRNLGEGLPAEDPDHDVDQAHRQQSLGAAQVADAEPARVALLPELREVRELAQSQRGEDHPGLELEREAVAQRDEAHVEGVAPMVQELPVGGEGLGAPRLGAVHVVERQEHPQEHRGEEKRGRGRGERPSQGEEDERRQGGQVAEDGKSRPSLSYPRSWIRPWSMARAAWFPRICTPKIISAKRGSLLKPSLKRL